MWTTFSYQLRRTYVRVSVNGIQRSAGFATIASALAYLDPFQPKIVEVR